ncbi:MAG: putative lipoprotein [Rhodopila sp.]|jgi:hypothetical protein|nr:putative lipoprotein [Rhodopila sp.]
MSYLHARLNVVACLIGLSALVSGCAVPDGGYGGYGAGVGVDYYEPAGFAYGGWGPGYAVGPYRDGDHRGGGGFHGDHAFRSPAAGHGMPSIPGGGRSGGGGHSGGGHGGGGHGGGGGRH